MAHRGASRFAIRSRSSLAAGFAALLGLCFCALTLHRWSGGAGAEGFANLLCGCGGRAGDAVCDAGGGIAAD